MDVLTGTTECDVDWRMLNMNAELVASSLSLTLRFYHCNGDGTRSERISMAMETRGPLADDV